MRVHFKFKDGDLLLCSGYNTTTLPKILGGSHILGIEPEWNTETNDCVFSFEPHDGCVLTLGGSNGQTGIVGSFGTGEQYLRNTLVKIEIGKGVISIANSTFRQCTSLSQVYIQNAITSIDSSAFRECYSLRNIVIPDSVVTIADSAFKECYSLRDIYLSKNLTTLGTSVFSDCVSLSHITLPDGITEIPDFAFNNCYSLTNLTIPSSVSRIGDSAFCNCYGIIEYNFSNHTSIPTLSNTNAFSNISKYCNIIVKYDLFESWKSATNWSDFYESFIYVTGNETYDNLFPLSLKLNTGIINEPTPETILLSEFIRTYIKTGLWGMSELAIYPGQLKISNIAVASVSIETSDNVVILRLNGNISGFSECYLYAYSDMEYPIGTIVF